MMRTAIVMIVVAVCAGHCQAQLGGILRGIGKMGTSVRPPRIPVAAPPYRPSAPGGMGHVYVPHHSSDSSRSGENPSDDGWHCVIAVIILVIVCLGYLYFAHKSLEHDAEWDRTIQQDQPSPIVTTTPVKDLFNRPAGHVYVAQSDRNGVITVTLGDAVPPPTEIRITSIPIGDAPFWVREAWIGLTLPVSPLLPGLQEVVGYSVVNGKMTQPILGYFVGVGDAVRVLADYHSEAAEWWKENSFHYQRRGGHLIFPADCCELCPGDGMTREAGEPN